jgi:hypothetical protein
MRLLQLQSIQRDRIARGARLFALAPFSVLFASCGGGGSNGSSGTSPPPQTTGSATLTWTAPTLRTDGTPLTNIAGFRIYYGTSGASYPNMVPVANDLTTYTVTNLTSGTTYYFVATVLDANGVESSYTNPVSKTIP